ncbi:MAG TPA: ferredoxin--NADP reductase [Thiobacillus sp.]|nr:MAG: ferredoxin--NADP(+) reductase [Hydrogenophilales bacterium 28-61-11]OYZ56462.1 MAG: ferredoxin--NADP(+) reductase [Hydrogenophilales bacterium 16-61-112]OZA45312.1 MAG: ferredoxin--NADP(+) reductase [Hydrogenophilales bacterium 17-61-76]HQT30545.1 ferredoxin--NADP reductase [Thiobacillus sp.]HQT70856.1 ferredoxin--NADP reductase [Thiobacillus sp.]
MPYSEQTVQSVRTWSDKTFSFTLSRPQDFAFANGEFVTLGLKREGKLVARAYSIVSTADRDHLEFLSIHVPDGPLTSQLVQVQPGSSVWVNSKATGSLTLNHVLPGRTLYMLATGTGLAPFISLVRDPATYAQFEQVVLVHSVRSVAELAYRAELETMGNPQLHYVPTVTRETFATPERGADLFRSGGLSHRLGLPQPDPEHDRVMICGNPEMTREMTTYLKDSGWTLTNHRGVGNFSTELAFVVHHE